MRVDVLLESTIVSERYQWDQRDSTYKYPSKYQVLLCGNGTDECSRSFSDTCDISLAVDLHHLTPAGWRALSGPHCAAAYR
jgi:hypothetical protein